MGFFDTFKNLSGNSPQPAQQAAEPQPVKRKVLIVEDDVMLRQFYTELLTGEGFAALSAENGQVGLDVIVKEHPDVVLLDLMMPVMDGKTMLRKLREIPGFESLPIIILTNAGDTESMHETRFYGNASEFLIKSNVTPPDIIDAVRRHLT